MIRRVFCTILLLVSIFCLASCSSEKNVWVGELFYGFDLDGPAKQEAEAKRLYFFEIPSFPFEDTPESHFSSRWHSCFTLEEEAEVFFEVGSDDGSIVKVDGRIVVDHWGTHGPSGRTGSIKLPRGTFKLEVDYFQATGLSVLYLKGRFGKRGPGRVLDSRFLTLPRKKNAKWICQ